MSFLTGKNKSQATSQSYNVNNPMLTSAFAPALGYTTAAGNGAMNFFNGDTSGFDNYKKAAGFDFAAKEGGTGILQNMASKSLRGSGAAAKALERYSTGLVDQTAGNYLQRLLGFGQLGLGAGGILASSGNTSNSQASSVQKKGLGELIAQAASSAAAGG